MPLLGDTGRTGSAIPESEPVGEVSQLAIRRCRPATWTALFALFFLTSALRAPVPAVNEPHYLGKAKHLWDPAWCAGDFFLESSNPHIVFYAAIGWLTPWFSLPATAWIGRAFALGLLSWGWMRLCESVSPSRRLSVTAGAFFVLLTSIGSFSGEWVIGGVEAKVFAYAFLLWAGAFWRERKLIQAGAAAGMAVSFHPVVGAWGVVAGVIAMVLTRIVHRGNHVVTDSKPAKPAASEPTSRAAGPDVTRPAPLRSLIPAAIVLILFSVQGLIPALQLVVGVDPALTREADGISITQRIGHHIDPRLFPERAYALYALLLAAWIALRFLTPSSPALRAVNRFVLGSLVIAATGLIVGWLPLEASPSALRDTVLKFYPFRLADLALPFAVALQLSLVVELLLAADTRPLTLLRPVMPVAALAAALFLPAPDANPSGMSPEVRRDWIATCGWLKVNTPPGALMGTANEDWAIKWYAGRPEYVSFKDCPQDAAGIVEWWRRRQTLVAWSREARADGVLSVEELADLHAETGIDYLVVSRYSGFRIEPVFATGPFKVYRLPK